MPMEYFLRLLQEHRFAYLVIVSLIATVLIINTTLEFAERVINNRLLLLYSMLVFYFLVQLALRKEIRK